MPGQGTKNVNKLELLKKTGKRAPVWDCSHWIYEGLWRISSKEGVEIYVFNISHKCLWIHEKNVKTPPLPCLLRIASQSFCSLMQINCPLRNFNLAYKVQGINSAFCFKMNVAMIQSSITAKSKLRKMLPYIADWSQRETGKRNLVVGWH